MNQETTDSTEKLHSEWGPSSLKYVAACKGWESRGGTSEAAEVGNRIHSAMETKNPAGLLDERENSIYEELVAMEERWLAQVFQFSEQPVEIHSELKLDITLPYDCSTFGTSDIVAVSGDVALVGDFKTGIGEIDDVDANYQSKAYSVGVFQRFPEVNVIHAVFLIPQRGQELHGVYTRDKLPEMEDVLARVILHGKTTRPKWFINAVSAEELTPNNGCQYCKHADHCPALACAAFELAERYDESWIPAGPVHSTEIDDPITLAKFYAVACIMDKWASGIKHKAVQSGLAGLPPDGYRMRSMGSTRKITDSVGFLAVAEHELELDTSELMQFADFPFAKIRDYYATKAKRGQKTAFAKRFEEVMTDANVIEAGTERFTLVKDT